MVGEIRDRETADIAIRAALTGPPGLLHAAHQRRAQRHHAPHRHGRGELPDHLLAGGRAGPAAGARDLPALQDLRPGPRSRPKARGSKLPRRGLRALLGTGYQGRVGIFELMELNDELRERIMAKRTPRDLTEVARRHGMRNLREDGWLKVARRRDAPPKK